MSLRRRAIKLLHWLFGSQNRVTVNYPCGHCDDVHPEGEKCPRVVERFCVDCDDYVALDRHFRCATDLRHTVDMTMPPAGFWGIEPPEGSKPPRSGFHVCR